MIGSVDVSSSGEAPLVSVVVLTFNHAIYLARAIESVLSQDCDFRFEVIVSDDMSTDDTRRILKEYCERFVGIVQDVSPPQHLGISENFVHAMSYVRGKYVSILDGDDAFVSADKLRRQLNLLECHSDASFSFHNALISREDTGGVRLKRSSECGQDPVFGDFLRGNPIVTSTVMFRRECLPELEWAKGIRLLDRAMWLILASRGRCLFLPQCYSLYRQHAGGAYTSATGLSKLDWRMSSFAAVRKFVPARERAALDQRAYETAVEALLDSLLRNLGRVDAERVVAVSRTSRALSSSAWQRSRVWMGAVARVLRRGFFSATRAIGARRSALASGRSLVV